MFNDYNTSDIRNMEDFLFQFEKLNAWHEARNLVVEVYRLLGKFPKTENYALCDQLRRAAISVPSNIAEGYARLAPKDYARFLTIARGSVFELETQLEICVRLDYLDQQDIQEALTLCDEVSKMLFSIISKL